MKDVFSNSGRGTVVTGRVSAVLFKVGDELEIVGIKDTPETSLYWLLKCSVTAWTKAAGDNVGVLLREPSVKGR